MLASMAVVLQLKKDVASYPPAEHQGRPTASVVRFSGGREVLPPVEPIPRLSRLPSRTAEPTSRNHSPASNASPGPGRRSSYRENTSSWSMFGSGFNLLGSNISIPHPPSLRETFLGRDGSAGGGGGAGDESLPSYSSHPIDAHRVSIDSGPADSSDVSTLDDRRRGRYRREEENSPPTPLRHQSDPTAPGGHGSSLRSKVLFGSGPSGNGAASYGAVPKMQSVAEVDLGGDSGKKPAKRPMVIKATFRVERPAPPSYVPYRELLAAHLKSPRSSLSPARCRSVVAGGHFLHPTALVVFHSAKAGYADFLWRWGLYQKRAELVKAHHLPLKEEQKPRTSHASAGRHFGTQCLISIRPFPPCPCPGPTHSSPPGRNVVRHRPARDKAPGGDRFPGPQGCARPLRPMPQARPRCAPACSLPPRFSC
jgi:hypothetical protein